MARKITPELEDRAVRMVLEHREDYSSTTAAAQAVAKQLGLGRETVQAQVNDVVSVRRPQHAIFTAHQFSTTGSRPESDGC